MRNNRLVITVLTAALCLLAATAMAGGIKERMKARVPAVTALKAKGIVGENNKGFLEFKAAPQQADLVKAENTDRAKVYQAIAAKTGATPNVVGQRRAAQIASQAPAGTWLQAPGGKWYRK